MIRGTFFVVLFCINTEAALMGKPMFAIIPHNVTAMPNEKYFSDVSTDVHKLDSGVTAVDAIGTILKQFPADAVIKILVKRQVGSKYVALGKPIQTNVCEFIGRDKVFYPVLRKYSNYPAKCPVTPGKLALVDFVLDTGSLPPVLPTGRIFADVQLLTKTETLLHIEINAEIVQN